MEDVLNAEIPGNFGEALRSGVLLCEVRAPLRGLITSSASRPCGLRQLSPLTSQVVNKIEPGKIPKVSTVRARPGWLNALCVPHDESVLYSASVPWLRGALNGPKRARPGQKTMPFPQRDNIKAFTDAARDLGVPGAENFETGDLFEQARLASV